MLRKKGRLNMNKPKDILNKSIEALAKTNIPPGPLPELINATVAKLTESGPPAFLRKQEGGQQEAETIKITDRLETAKRLIKYAAAAVIMLFAGYIAGRLSAPKAPDVKQLQAALVPALRQNLLGEMTQYWQASLASGFTQLKDEISRQYRRDMTDFAIQTLATTNAVTNQRLENLIKAINNTHMEDRRSVATAIEQIELNRRLDKTQLATGLETLALQTENQLQQTRHDIFRLLSYTETQTPNNTTTDTNERSKK
ncbi:MAG: hypothetical protein MUP16_04700 [Sedimentisphaerales bacterium]|nr:hypothetical protein [Sedimentisphaerales bacterium]